MVRRLPGRQAGGSLRGRLLRWLPVLSLLLLVLALAACGNPTDAPQSTIAQDGANNDRIWDVYNILWIGAAVVFVLVEGLLFYTVFRFRRRPRTAHGRPVPVHGNTKLEILWTIIPAVVLVVIAVPTLQIMADLNDVPDEENAIKVEVVAHQFFFEFRYEDEQIASANTLVIPEDTSIDIVLRSADVIHSFWVPRLAGKTDNVPGRANHMWLEADDPGIYEGQCAEFCGTGHGLMRFKVDVRSQQDYLAWVDEKQNPSATGDPEAGMDLVVNGTCAGCHAIEGTSAQGAVGPALTGLADRPQIAGVLENTPENLAKWLDNPPAVKPGTAMPDLPLNEADIRNIVAYLETLTGGE